MTFKLLLIAAAASLMILACEGRSMMSEDEYMLRDDSRHKLNWEIPQHQTRRVDVLIPQSDRMLLEEELMDSYYVPKIRHDDDDQIMDVRSKINRAGVRGQEQVDQHASHEDLINTIYKNN